MWERAIILMDMNAFFASIEQYDFPELRGLPIAVTNGEQGSCIITCSYEARRHGIRTGMRFKEALVLCPELIRCPSRQRRYAEVSSKIMSSLQEVTPDIETFSVDEAFLDITHCQALHGDPVDIAKWVKTVVYEASGLQCSVGLSGDKTTAKYAAGLDKPDGLTVIHPDDAKARLANVPVTELCGIGKRTGHYLAEHGVFVCGDMASLPISQLAKRFGNIGRRMWYMCQGEDPDKVHVVVPPPKSIGHGKVTPPKLNDKDKILTYLSHMVEKVAIRLRRHELMAQHFFVGVRCYDWGWLGGKYRLKTPTQDSRDIYQLCESLMEEEWQGQGIGQVQITALDPHKQGQQLDLFDQEDLQRQRTNHIMDIINERFGEFTLAPARLLNRTKAPDVIAPAWRPTGPRRSC